MEISLRGNLEMRVAVYAKLAHPPSEEDMVSSHPLGLDDGLFVIYAGDDPCGFYERIGAPEEFIELIGVQQRISPPKGAVRVYSSFLPASSEDAIRNGLEDVIRVDVQDTPSESIAATSAAMGIYLFFRTKLQRNKVQEVEEEETVYEELELPEPEHYSQIKESLIDYLADWFFTPLMRAYHHDDDELLEKIKQDLYVFVRDAPFEADMYELCDEIMVGYELRQVIIVSYVAKIEAIHQEDYEKAATLRDKIYRLKHQDGLSDAA